jgi:bifunctional NMN adenylyltransferase/nudix hydrolase
VAEVPSENGTVQRQQAAAAIGTSTAWRQGVIHATLARPALTYGTVDVAVLRPGAVLLAEKRQDQGRLRFIGGFLDATDTSDEAAARRELREEAGSFEVADWRYLGSTRIDDWRYRGTPDGIMTRFFVTTHVFGRPEASDDIDALHWVSRDTFAGHLITSHAPLGQLLAQWLRLHPHH